MCKEYRRFFGAPRDLSGWLVGGRQRSGATRECGRSRRARVCTLMRWGLVPFWAKGVPPKYSTINARIEGMTTAPSYRSAWKWGAAVHPAGNWFLRVAGARRHQATIFHPRDRVSSPIPDTADNGLSRRNGRGHEEIEVYGVADHRGAERG